MTNMVEVKGKEIRNVAVCVDAEDIIKHLYDIFGFSQKWELNNNNEVCIDTEEYSSFRSSF